MSNFVELLERAEARREDLVARLSQEGTDCRRLFHGVAEGWPGLTIDKYGPLVLAQTFRANLPVEMLQHLEHRYGTSFVYNHRGDREQIHSYHRPHRSALQQTIATEFSYSYAILARHRGIDPHLFLDFRVGRRWLLAHSKGKSVLNLFSYTCSLGQVARAAGATEVWNVDFSESALEVGRENLALNELSVEGVRFIKEDVFPVLWQLADLGVKGKRAKRSFRRFAPQTFDLVLLDPPARAKGHFHTVDLKNDYQSLFKPALLACATGGRVMAANNLGSVSRQEFGTLLTRCAEKAGRPLKSVRWLTPDDDFPSFDGEHPLKIALCEPSL